MTPEERISQLEEALALERAKVHELSAALAAAVSADAHSKRVAADRKAARAAQNRAAYERRKQAQQPIQHEIQRAESGAESPSPLLDGSPLSSKPSLPSPLSSPQPLSASQGTASPSPDFELTSPTSKKRGRQPSAAEAMWVKIQETREARCVEVGAEVVPERWDFAKQNKLVGAILRESEAAQRLFESAWGLYLADDGQRARLPAWSFSYFLKVRSQYETMAAREEAE